MKKIIFFLLLTSQAKASCPNISGQYQVACPLIQLETGGGGGTVLQAFHQDEVIGIEQAGCIPQINGGKLFQYMPVMHKKEQQYFQQDFFVLVNGFTQINYHGAYTNFKWDIGNPYDLSGLSYLLDLVHPKKWIPQKIKVQGKIEIKSIVQNDSGDLWYSLDKLDGGRQLVTQKECYLKKL